MPTLLSENGKEMISTFDREGRYKGPYGDFASILGSMRFQAATLVECEHI